MCRTEACSKVLVALRYALWTLSLTTLRKSTWVEARESASLRQKRCEKKWQLLPCMFLGMCPCSPYDRASPRDSVSTLGSMSALPAWAGLRSARRDTWTWEADVPTQTRLRVSQMSLTLLISSLSVSRSFSPNYRTMLWMWSPIQTIQTVSQRPAGSLWPVRAPLWSKFSKLICHICVCAQNPQ